MGGTDMKTVNMSKQQKVHTCIQDSLSDLQGQKLYTYKKLLGYQSHLWLTFSKADFHLFKMMFLPINCWNTPPNI